MEITALGPIKFIQTWKRSANELSDNNESCLVVFLKLLFKLVPVLFVVVHAVKSCLTDVCLDPFVMVSNGR